LVPYRTYCKHDISVMQKLMGMITYLKKIKPAGDNYHKILDREANMMIHDVSNAVKNPTDLAVLQEIYDRMDIKTS